MHGSLTTFVPVCPTPPPGDISLPTDDGVDPLSRMLNACDILAANLHAHCLALMALSVKGLHENSLIDPDGWLDAFFLRCAVPYTRTRQAVLPSGEASADALHVAALREWTRRFGTPDPDAKTTLHNMKAWLYWVFHQFPYPEMHVTSFRWMNDAPDGALASVRFVSEYSSSSRTDDPDEAKSRLKNMKDRFAGQREAVRNYQRLCRQHYKIAFAVAGADLSPRIDERCPQLSDLSGYGHCPDDGHANAHDRYRSWRTESIFPPVVATSPARTWTAGEAGITVREYLTSLGSAGSEATRDSVSKATGIPTGTVSNTPAWKALSEEKKRRNPSRKRHGQLADATLSVVADHKAINVKDADTLIAEDVDAKREALLAELIADQGRDAAESGRRQSRRHSPS